MQNSIKIESGFLSAQKIFRASFQEHIKNSEFWLAELKHHKLPKLDRSARTRPSTNQFLRIAVSLDPYPTWAEPEAWTCEEKRTAGSSGTKSLHVKWSEEKMPWRVADSSRYPAWLKIVWRFYFCLILKQDISNLSNCSFCLKFEKNETIKIFSPLRKIWKKMNKNCFK